MTQLDLNRQFKISACTEKHFETVKQSVQDLQLDDREMIPEQFLVAEENGQVIGYVRSRSYSEFSELCTLGVPEAFRSRGVAVSLVSAFLKKSNRPLYVVTVIPEFFAKLGFEICEDYPFQIHQKLGYCKGSLAVEDPYVVMRSR